MLDLLRKIIPAPIFQALQPSYHATLSFLGALFYGFPARKLKIVGITGTKGKTTTAEIINAILEEAGYRTALAGTLRFKVAGTSRRNLYKMTMPGRFFMQKFLREAANNVCGWVIIEMTSEGVKQYRHKWLHPDALIFTNIAPEHIESHGSFENYLHAKLRLATELYCSPKKNKAMISNVDDKYGQKFLDAAKVKSLPYSLRTASPYIADEKYVSFTFKGIKINSPLRGIFNIYNLLAATVFADAIGIDVKVIDKAIGEFRSIRGRVEFVRLPDEHPHRDRQEFDVIVDYAHTPESLEALYKAFANQQKICVLGNTGGGRDKWKRPRMGEIADRYCEKIVLTNEDPYDENPLTIVEEMKKGIKNKPCEIILDRREAIRQALLKAKELASTKSQITNHKQVAVLITGKGTDPYIMGPKGSKQNWDDAEVVREELEKLLAY